MSADVWYRSYEVFNAKVLELREKFLERCKELQVAPNVILREFTREFLTRAVHESNWQEGLELDRGKTQELASLAFDELEDVAGPHLDMKKILRFHRSSVLKMKADGASVEEIGAYNLARAHHAIVWVGSELANRQVASLAKALRGLQSHLPDIREKAPPEHLAEIEKRFAVLNELVSDKSPIHAPMTAPQETRGQMMQELLDVEFDNLLHPMRCSYLHFFHRLTLMGILSPGRCGRFRKISVHVGNFDLYFPPPSAVPQMMREFCHSFPTILPQFFRSDSILVAAKASHQFVAIHPYEDGNGRVSRLIMNLVLWEHFPPVYLKADKKGRHRYGQAIRRADRGDIKPLAALIAMSLIEIYTRLLQSLGVSTSSGG